MKRMMILLLLVAMLVGCTAPDPTDPGKNTEPPTTVQTEPTASHLYNAGSAVEQQTGGAVREYPLGGQFNGMLLVDGQVALYHLGEQMQIRTYIGDNLTQNSVASYHIMFPENAQGIQISENGIFYYDPAARTMVILDHQFSEKMKKELPAEIQGIPVINGAMDTVYYCTPEGIRAMGLDTGIARMLRQQNNYSGKLIGQCFDGKYLACQVTAEDGTMTTEFISVETGLFAGKTQKIGWIDSYGDAYLLRQDTDQRIRYVFGTTKHEPSEFFVDGEGKTVYPALEAGAALTLFQNDDGYIMDLYLMESGIRTASVTLNGVKNVRNVVADTQGHIWFLADGALYRWDFAKSQVVDETVYTSSWYTNSDPNEEGLQQCQQAAQMLGEKYGVEIRVWKDAVQGPWSKMIAEYRVDLIQDALADLEAMLSLFPEGKLQDIGSICNSGKVRISIVSDTGSDQGQMAWDEGNGHIAVATGETFQKELLRAFYRIMDSYVLSKTSRLDQWNAQKPAEQRAEYFAEALLEDNRDFFAKSAAQTKLETLCRAIRDAFGMKKHKAQLPWEQYLDKQLY